MLLRLIMILQYWKCTYISSPLSPTPKPQRKKFSSHTRWCLGFKPTKWGNHIPELSTNKPKAQYSILKFRNSQGITVSKHLSIHHTDSTSDLCCGLALMHVNASSTRLHPRLQNHHAHSLWVELHLHLQATHHVC